MSEDDFPVVAPGRPIWLMTLADLALLLVGFFVLIQATQTLDRKALAKGLREGFGAPAPVVDPIAVASNAVFDFTPGSATMPSAPGLAGWAREALADPRVTIRVSGSTDGTPADVDRATGSAAILAADRARGVAAALAAAGVRAPGRFIIVNAPGSGRRGVLLTQSFIGDRP